MAKRLNKDKKIFTFDHRWPISVRLQEEMGKLILVIFSIDKDERTKRKPIY